MRLTIYIASLLIAVVLLVYGIMGNLGTALSYKFETEDPAAEIAIDRLPHSEQQTADARLQEKRNQLESQEYLFTGLILLSIISIVLLLIYRKRILADKMKLE